MRRTPALILSLLFLLFPIAPALSQVVTGTDFPFARFEMRTPPFEDPLPGMGTGYSTLSQGIETALWNPASLTRIKHAQTALSFVAELQTYGYDHSFETEDGQYTFGDSDNFSLGYYLTGDESVTTAATREHTTHSLYRTQSTGLSFKQALKFNEWFTFGVLTHNDMGMSIDMSGAFPAIAQMRGNFLNTSDFMGSGLSIDSSGVLTFTHTSEGGGTYEYKTVTPLWSGFLNQSSNVPVTAIVEARNDITVQPGITLCGAMKWRDLSMGTSLTPISATANVNNNVRAVVKEGTPDIFLYQPDFDPEVETDALNWVQDPNRYGSESGYKRNSVNVPAGEVIGEAIYKGFYQASALRTDLGFTYDLGEIVTLGLMLENIGSAALDFRGSGRVAYVQSRISTAEPPSLDPAEEFNWTPFKDDFEPVEGAEDLFLQEQVNVELPKKIRFGAALRKPFLIALDLEQNQTPIIYRYIEDDQEKIVEVSNIQILRLGMESRVLMLPMWIRAGFPLMFKPTVTGLDADAQQSFDDVFQFGVVPLGFNMGSEINFWGTYVGSSFGVNATPILAFYQLDSTNQDLGRISFYDLYVMRGPWKVTYLATFDPASTAGAYGSRTDKDQEFGVEHVRWIQTLTVSYKF